MMWKFIERGLQKSEEFGYQEGFLDGMKYVLNHYGKG